MNRDNLINKLVARKMANGPAKAGCVPCFAGTARKLCWVGVQRPAAAPKR